jgi:NAD(P)-dependent dehydrogenase (short-subunit alcohol dehydrogenase family)
MIVWTVTTLTGKTALVTGGTRGIGLAIAHALVARGVSTAITGTHDRRLEDAARTLSDTVAGGAIVLPLHADVRAPHEVIRAVETAATSLGGLEILVNNAGVGVFKPVSEMTAEEWHLVLETNLSGVFHCCRAALPHLKRQGGWIVNISSLAGSNPFPDGAAYCASKAALNAFSEALMQEVRHDGVRVAYVQPGSVRTGFMGRAAGADEWKLAPEDVAEAVVSLLVHPSRSLPSRVEIRPARPPRKA